MSVRSLRERVLQTLTYESGGLLLVTPAYAHAFGASAADSLAMLLAMSIMTMVWEGLHNTLFDLVDLKLSGRVASDRPHAWRCVHALSCEFSSTLVTVPLIMWLGGFDFWSAITVDIAFSLFYAAYGDLFHWLFDRIRPVAIPLSADLKPIALRQCEGTRKAA